MNTCLQNQPHAPGSKFSVRDLALSSLFVALILLLGFTPIGMIPLPGITISLLALPVVVGTLSMDVKHGLIFGACFAGVSVSKAFGINGAPSALVALLMEQSKVYVLIMSILPRLLVPINAALIYRLLSRHQEKNLRAVPFAALVGSLTNTVFYLGLMLLFFVMTGLDTKGVLLIIGGTGLISGSLEAAACALISTPILAALWKVQRSKKEKVK